MGQTFSCTILWLTYHCYWRFSSFSELVYKKLIELIEFIIFWKFIPGIFQKSAINDGTIVNGLDTFDTSADGLNKVRAFVRYAYKTSASNLIISDIQGNMLCDPEIATKEIADINDEVLFCSGKLETNLIQVFLGAYKYKLRVLELCLSFIGIPFPFLRGRRYCYCRTYLHPTLLVFLFLSTILENTRKPTNKKQAGQVDKTIF